MSLPELSDSEMAILQGCLSYQGRPVDSGEIRLQARTLGLNAALDPEALIKRLVELGYLAVEKHIPIDPKAQPSETPYYTVSPSGRERVLLHSREWEKKGGK